MRNHNPTPLEQITDTPRPGCILCARALEAHELQTCQHCVGRTRANLFAIADAYRLLPSLLGLLGTNHIRIGGGESRLPGGDILVMLAGGSNASSRLRAYFAGHDPDFDQDDQAGDPPSVAYALGRWEDDWRQWRGEPAAIAPMTVQGAFAYLAPKVSWAAQWHVAFDEFATDIRTLRHQVEVAAKLDSTPMRAAVACFDCGQHTLERRYLPSGLEDDWTCRTCRRRYDQASYFLAIRAMLEETA